MHSYIFSYIINAACVDPPLRQHPEWQTAYTCALSLGSGRVSTDVVEGALADILVFVCLFVCLLGDKAKAGMHYWPWIFVHIIPSV